MKITRVLASIVCLALAGSVHAAPRKSRIKKAGAGEQDALLKGGLESLQRKEFTAAIDDFQKLSKSRGDSASYFLLGYAYYQRGFRSGMPESADKQDALETVNAYMTAVALDPSLSQVEQPYKLWHSLGMSYEALGADDKALDAYKKAMLAAPRNPMLPLYASRLRLKMNDVDRSVENLSLALKVARASGHQAEVTGAIKASPLFAGLISSPAHARVLHSYDASIEAPAAAPVVASGRRMQEPELRDAVSDGYGLRDSIRAAAAQPARPQLSQKDQAVMDQLATAAEDYKFRRYRQAIASYGEVLLLNQDSGVLSPPQLAMVHERVGTAYNRLGQSQEAVRELQRALQDMPFDTAAHYQLALAYAVSGQYRDSIHALSETFKTSATAADLRRYMLLAKTDTELEAVRDLPAFQQALEPYAQKLHSVGR